MGGSDFFVNVHTKRELILVLSFRFGVGIGWLRVAENWAVLKRTKKSGVVLWVPQPNFMGTCLEIPA